MTEQLHVAVFDTLADWEIGYLTAHLANGAYQRPGFSARVVTVGLSPEPITTMGGLRVTPEVTVDQVDPARSLGLVLPGGETWTEPELQPFVALGQQFLDADKVLAAICGATFALAAAGILDTRRHTSNDGGWLASSGYAGTANYCVERAVTDQQVVTAGGMSAVPFTRAVFEAIGSHDPDVLDAWELLYGSGDPAGYFALEGAG